MTSPKKPHLLKITPPFDSSFILKGDAIPWDNPWHYHPELELIFCIKGKGTNFIGNDIRSIEEGEILLLGSNLPHTRQRDKLYYENNKEDLPQSIIVQFNHDFLGNDFFKILEFEHIDILFKKALSGLKFTGETLGVVGHKLLLMSDLNKTTRVLELLSILDILAKSTEYELMNANGYVSDVHEKNSQKINQVYEYTITNFRKQIELSEIAALTNLSISAFCRYFKTRTRKSYFQYLAEVRIGYACRLLSEGDLDIGQIAYQSGYNNLSNFNKQFKTIMKTTPRNYLGKISIK